MKKISSFLAFICFFSIGFSQQETLLKSKNGTLILPETGDFAIGIGANSLFDYIGNLLSSSGNNHLSLNLINNNVLYGKYFLTSQSAIRIKLIISQLSSHFENKKVTNDLVKSNFVTDKLDNSLTDLGFSIGYEKRKGFDRLQIPYGAELILSFSTQDSKYTYGNNFSKSNNSPTSTIGSDFLNTSRLSSRPLEDSRNGGIGFGARLFVGVEYFIFPRISIGGEIGLGYLRNFNGGSKVKNELWNYSKNSVGSSVIGNSFNTSNLNTDILNGQICILIHL
jgi:hypothetical protein